MADCRREGNNMDDHETIIKYRCPYCKLLGSNEQNVIPFGQNKREKHRGGRYTEYRIGMCKDCGTLFCYEQLETTIFIRKGRRGKND